MQNFRNKKFLVTAGPTVEKIDPVRFLSNHSTGKMGYAIAAELAARGADVTLVSGPTALDNPVGVKRIDVVSAEDMYRECTRLWPEMDGAVMCAAVADYAPAHVSEIKLKKTDNAICGQSGADVALTADREEQDSTRRTACDERQGSAAGAPLSPQIFIELKPTKDIAAELGRTKREGQILVGFALETDNEQAHALAKLESKNLDMIVLNSLRDAGAGFGGDTNRITIFERAGKKTEFPLEAKTEAAKHIVDKIETL